MSSFLKFSIVCLLNLCVSPAWAAEVYEELPAGGVYVFQALDKYTIKCTAEPVEPTVLSKSCGCFGSASVRPVFLRMKALLSNGKAISYDIANADTMDQCESKLAGQYLETCSN